MKEEIYWKSEYQTGVIYIDEQHKKLLKMINNLIKAKVEEKDEVLKGTFINLVDYFIVHFRDEEELMEKHNYPFIEEHKRHHKILVKQVAKILEDYKKENENTLDNLRQTLVNWFVRHILVHDMQYVDFVK